MRTFLVRRFIPVAMCAAVITIAVACAGDDSASPATTTATVADDAAATPSNTPPAPILSSDIPLETFPPYDSADIPVAPVDSADLPIIITVTVGVDSAPDRVDTVPLGATVSLTVVNPTTDDEFHFHGFDLGDGREVPAGQNQTFTFSAATPGEFELESHATDEVLLTLRVA